MRKKAWVMAALLFGAQVNLAGLVPAGAGQGPPPWWVGGGIVWPFFADTSTLLPAGALRDALTPILGTAAALCFLFAAAALVGRFVPTSWFRVLVILGAGASIVLQVAWLSGWAVLPLVADAVLLWVVGSGRPSVSGLLTTEVE